MRKYYQLNYGEQIPEKHTQNLSGKFNQINQEENEEKHKNNQDNSKITYAAAFKVIDELNNKTRQTEN